MLGHPHNPVIFTLRPLGCDGRVRCLGLCFGCLGLCRGLPRAVPWAGTGLRLGYYGLCLGCRGLCHVRRQWVATSVHGLPRAAGWRCRWVRDVPRWGPDGSASSNC